MNWNSCRARLMPWSQPAIGPSYRPPEVMRIRARRPAIRPLNPSGPRSPRHAFQHHCIEPRLHSGRQGEVVHRRRQYNVVCGGKLPGQPAKGLECARWLGAEFSPRVMPLDVGAHAVGHEERRRISRQVDLFNGRGTCRGPKRTVQRPGCRRLAAGKVTDGQDLSLAHSWLFSCATGQLTAESVCVNPMAGICPENRSIVKPIGILPPAPPRM